MRQLVNNLSKMLDNYELLRGGSDFLQSEGVEWHDADRAYVENLQAWADTVEALLSAAGRDTDAQIWQTARKVQASVLNVDEHAERLYLLLQQIKSRIEQEYNYAPDLAQVIQTPFLSQVEISDAYRMSELYVILYCYENSVRRFVEKVLLKAYGEKWWEKRATDVM